ncbi:hypothetical protein [Brevibacillus agri]|uniref:hypothetical protein n=1 Tax=Brevibacillus agri TaxID=51101 RepID=UPI0028706333|nr:hypothetical protein [Brevibacillus agri]MDR9505656.1 hypothetical protein [Brevibacillus agri]
MRGFESHSLRLQSGSTDKSVGSFFVGVERSRRNKQARICENTLWISPTEERIPVREIVEIYEQKEKMGELSSPSHGGNLSRIRFIVETINYFEKRYAKPYQEVVSEKGNPDAPRIGFGRGKERNGNPFLKRLVIYDRQPCHKFGGFEKDFWTCDTIYT